MPVRAASVSSFAAERSSVITASSTTRTSIPVRPSPDSIRFSQEAAVREGMAEASCSPCAPTADRHAPAYMVPVASHAIRHASMSVDLPAPATPTTASMPFPAVSSRVTTSRCCSDNSKPAATANTDMAASAFSGVRRTVLSPTRARAW